jgi:[calcium/calmodulin-dependent protein kinase] kinase
MVLEMCKKGVIMKVGLDEMADPYDDEDCRCWFRDLILGIEYCLYPSRPGPKEILLTFGLSAVHAQGVVHRDIKPDNLLLTNENVLKIVDFGVSEMFEKSSEMLTAKSAGSPAFLPPELCVARHGEISGKAADVWSMGVTLYCLRFGKLPFERIGVLDLYEAIRTDVLTYPPDTDHDFLDLMEKLLEKDPAKRIKMHELRVGPSKWLFAHSS